MLVPAGMQSRLPYEVTGLLTVLNATQSIYDFTTEPRLPYGHLLNFYQNENTLSSGAVKVAHYYRIFDFVEVPSRFVGTASWFDPTNTLPTYHPPFNYLSRFRDPGLININTMPGSMLTTPTRISNSWAGLTANTFTTWVNMETQRRGTVDTYGRHGNPFRGCWADATTSNVKLTLLRNETSAVNTAPLLTRQLVGGGGTAPGNHNAFLLHPYFFLQGIHRLANLTTTRSNVYAIWITVGYFEVNAAGNPVTELNLETGENRRHRGFFIVDRSIPVAYQRGVNHNVDKTILLRRYIE
jgi:hypothetical protein